MDWRLFWITLKPRLKSFAWRTADYLMVQGIAFIAANLDLFHLPVWAVMIISQILGEATKWLNNHTDIFGFRLK